MNEIFETQIGPMISATGYALEVVGVIIIVLGFLWASGRMLGNRAGIHGDERYRAYRRDLARSMLLGLEFLVAGDIIRTVVVAHSLTDVLSLGLIVLIRTVLVFTVHLEVEGRWPWQDAKAGAESGGS